MARKRHSDEDLLKLLREIEVHVHSGMGSTGAMARGSADRYFQAEISQPLKLLPERAISFPIAPAKPTSTHCYPELFVL